VYQFDNFVIFVNRFNKKHFIAVQAKFANLNKR
jgi:hypothetical protein